MVRTDFSPKLISCTPSSHPSETSADLRHSQRELRTSDDFAHANRGLEVTTANGRVESDGEDIDQLMGATVPVQG